MDAAVETYAKAARKHLDALKEHDDETQRLLDEARGKPFPWRKREDARRMLSASLEGAVEGLLRVLS